MDEPRDREESKPSLDLNRRQFLGGVGGVTAGTLAGGLTGVAALSGLTAEEGVAQAAELGPLAGEQRRNAAFQIRHQAAVAEKNEALPDTPTNGDEELYPTRVGNHHKCLPHDSGTGLVDPAAYDSLLNAIQLGTVAAYENVTLAGGRLLNPVAANAYTLEGPDTQAIGVPEPPPAIYTPEVAADAAELYWMMLTRDVPFTDYATNSVIADACADLNNLPGYRGPLDPSTSTVTPRVLFRMDSPGVLDGPMVSQFLLRNWVYDAASVPGKVNTAQVGTDFMTEWNEWLNVENGLGVNPTPPLDSVQRFLRDTRDLATYTALDRVMCTYIKPVIIMQNFSNVGTGAGFDANWPYTPLLKQSGFCTFGLAWVLETVCAVGLTERHTWWEKWNLHRSVRPEAYGGLVHKAVADGMDLPIHSDLTDVSTVLPRVFAANAARNIARGLPGGGTYLLSQSLRTGCPNHPSFPSGHAFTAGACVTLLKAVYDENALWPSTSPATWPVKPAADGITTTQYVIGVDGPPLTIGGELNKLAHNMAFGRNMSGIHWRGDNVAGLLQGEAVAIRYLKGQIATYPEPFAGFTLTKFDGTTITIA